MSIMEILLLVIGAVIFAAGFIVPEKIGGKFTDPGVARAQNEIRKAADDSVENAKQRISDIVNTQSGVAQDETERAMDRITNDKIMAINEYGKTVIDEIEKNHKEVLFLYDMLNNKAADLKNTVRKAESVQKTEKTQQPEKSEKEHANEQMSGIDMLRKAAEVKIPRALAVPPAQQMQQSKQMQNGQGTKHDDLHPAQKEKEEQTDISQGQSRLNRKIIEMHNDGKSDVEIARTLGIGVGEVKLKVNLTEAGETQ